MAKEKSIHKRIQKAIKTEFIQHGMSYGKKEAQLKVAYLVMIQNNAMTTSYSEYFGYGRNAGTITDIAHLKGVTKGVRPDFFERAGLLVDVIDAKTNKLVFRNYTIGDITKGASNSTRQININRAVQQALSPFFKK